MAESMKLFFEKQTIPLVIKNRLNNWPLLHYSKHQWCEIFNGSKLNFRKGEQTAGNSPKWESSCSPVLLTLDEFFKISEENISYWLYFDYKEMDSLFLEKNANILDEVKWENLGYTNRSGKDTTLWIGNKGAHTPCHMDSYGYNLIAQLHGRKQWLLMPPEEASRMQATRVPYEESSVYSQMDFYSPKNNLLNLECVYKVTLEPGDVLLVPRHWWHYVENLEVAISVNTWIPTDEDIEVRLEEALVQRLIWTIIQGMTEHEAKILLNPNEYHLLENMPKEQVLLTVAQTCLQQRYNKAQNRKNAQLNNTATESLPETEVKENSYEAIPTKIQKISKEIFETPNIRNHKLEVPTILEKDVVFLKPLTKQQLTDYLEDRAKTQGDDIDITEKEQKTELTIDKMLINAFCHPETLILAKEKFLEQLNISEYFSSNYNLNK